MSERYTPEWRASQADYTPYATRALLIGLGYLGLPRSLLDIGCGNGALVELAGRLGVRAVGVDLALRETVIGDYYTLWRKDLREPLDLGEDYELVLCCEVAEHLPPEAAALLVESVARHTGRWLLWTAAQPGQGGDGHVHEQPPEYWRERLARHGLRPREDLTRQLCAAWAPVVGPASWYANNLLVMERLHEGDL